jgi:hypothetical protein
VAVVTLGVGVPEEDVVGKQDCAGCNRAYGVPEEDVVGKQNGAAMIGSRGWAQECQTMTYYRKMQP